MAESTHILPLCVTDEQEEILRGFFNFYNWDFRTISEDDRASSRQSTSTSRPEENPSETSNIESTDTSESTQNEDTICLGCFCDPCITSPENRQMWWPESAVLPHMKNRRLRNTVYKNFWAMMYNRGKWTDPRYKARKAQAFAQDQKMRRYRWHKREIMPNCVLSTVRSWYPKTDSESYVGHKWN